jgi:hypothetical protein
MASYPSRLLGLSWLVGWRCWSPCSGVPPDRRSARSAMVGYAWSFTVAAGHFRYNRSHEVGEL